MHHSYRALKLQWVLAVVGSPWIEHQPLVPTAAPCHFPYENKSKLQENSRTLHQHPYPFEKFCSNHWFWINFNFRNILKSRSIARGNQLVLNIVLFIEVSIFKAYFSQYHTTPDHHRIVHWSEHIQSLLLIISYFPRSFRKDNTSIFS
jgi:hypothetical protein